MPFNPGERSLIIKVLEINRLFDTPDSKVQSVMNHLEFRDSQYGTDYVAEVQALIIEYGQIKADPAILNFNPYGLEEVELDKDYRVRFHNASSGNEAVSVRLDEIKTEIQNILDPDCELLDCLDGSGTVIHCM